MKDIAIFGDSAGGGLAASSTLQIPNTVVIENIKHLGE